MNFLDLKDIAEQFMTLVNPIAPEKVTRAGEMAGLRPGRRVIDFGAGYAEPLALWGLAFGIQGVGIEIRPAACERARQRLAELGLSDHFTIVCQSAATYPVAAGAYDVATCLGASFIWGGFQPAVRALRRAIHAQGRVIIGEPYWLHSLAPPAYIRQESSFHTEAELYQIIRQQGFELAYVVRASHDDWDRYEADNWRGLLAWLEANPEHPERAEVWAHLHHSQTEYIQYAREHCGWALYVLQPSPAGAP